MSDCCENVGLMSFRKKCQRFWGPRGRFPALARRCAALMLAIVCATNLQMAYAGALTAGERAYARHDYTNAARLLLPEAQSGRPLAQTYLGYMYQNGLGVPRDYAVAAGWLVQAADQGEPTAQFLLGLLFDKGFGVPKDWVQAEVWLNLAASQASANERDYWSRVRDAVAQKLTLNQLAEAQRRAVAWSPIGDRIDGAVSARY